MKTVLFLGAAQFQLPPIQYAISRGYRVITCDNVPSNPGHKLAHRSYPISTVDKEGVLEVAKREGIDGVMTFGSDVSSPAAAFVGEKLGLSTNPLDSIETLTNKAAFRDCLAKAQLQGVQFQTFSACERCEAIDFVSTHPLPLIVKPVDASGSKGVSVVSGLSERDRAIDKAFESSLSKRILIEEFIIKSGKQVCGDGFAQDGRIVMLTLGDGHFYDDEQFMVPFAETFPSSHPDEWLLPLREKLQSVLQAAGFRQGPFNVDALITTSGEPWIIEIGPRSGGNFIPRAIHLHTNIDVTAASVELCLDSAFRLDTSRPRPSSCHACYMIHSRASGVLHSVEYANALSSNIVEEHPYLRPGEKVEPFHRANAAIGNVILQFGSVAEMDQKMSNIHSLCKVALKN